MVFRAGLENATNFLFVLRANFRSGLENAANFLSLSSRIFALGSKMRRIFSLCFSEITPETSRNDARIFERNFVESSQGQRTKFAHFALITFSQYCSSLLLLTATTTTAAAAAAAATTRVIKRMSAITCKLKGVEIIIV